MRVQSNKAVAADFLGRADARPAKTGKMLSLGQSI